MGSLGTTPYGVRLPLGVSLAALVTAFTRVSMTAAKKKASVPLPSLKNTPNGANPKALEKHWKEFVKKYSSVWGRYKTEPDRQWACCVAIWVNYCLKRKVQPFDANASTVTGETKEKIDDRTRGARVSQLNAMDSLVSRGNRKGLISNVLREVFISLEEKKPGEFTITTRRFLKLEKGIEYDSKEFKAFMAKCNYQRKAGKYIRTAKTNAYVAVTYDQGEDRPVVLLINKVTSSYAEMLLGLPSERGNRDKVKAALVKYWKALIKDID